MNSRRLFSGFLLLAIGAGGFFAAPGPTSAAAERPEARADSIIIKYKDAEEIVEHALGTEPLERALARFDGDPRVEYAEPNYVYRAAVIPSDTYVSNQWYLKRIYAHEAWSIQTGSPDVIIAVIDSGVQISHPDLRDNIWRNPNETENQADDDGNGYADDLYGWDFVNQTPDPSPKFKTGFTASGILHGTIVSGIAAARGDNNQGVAGVSWQAKIMALKALDDTGSGDAATVIKAIDYAVRQGAHIINLSFVGGGHSRAFQEALARARDANVVVVAPAGNEQVEGKGLNLNETPVYPACYRDEAGRPLVTAVAATDGLDAKTGFSGYGSACIALAAPGVSFYSTSVYAPDRSGAGGFFNQFYDGYWSGTSMAVPVVSGTLALIMAAHPGLSAEAAVAIMRETADSIDELNPQYSGQLGSGRVNAFSAVVEASWRLLEREAFFAVAAAPGAPPYITILDSQGAVAARFLAYPADFTDGINLAAGDVDGDGEDEIIAAPMGNREADVRIFSRSGAFKGNFLAYPLSFRGGVNLAIIDMDRPTGAKEIVTAPAGNYRPEVKIFTADGKMTGNFLAYDRAFTGGVSLATGNIIGETGEEIVVAPYVGSSSEIKVFSPAGVTLSRFRLAATEALSGWRVAAADVDGPRHRPNAELIVSRRSGPAEVRVVDFRGIERGRWYAYDRPFTGDVLIAAADLDRNGYSEIIAAPAAGGDAHIRIFDYNRDFIRSFYAFEPGVASGANFAVLLSKRQ